MSIKEIDKKLMSAIEDYREQAFRQAFEDAKDSGDEDYKIRDHIENEYNKHDIDEITDQVQDLILDSIGS